MDPVERQKIAALTVHLATRIQAAVGDSWPARRDTAKELIQSVYETWWNVHARDPNAYGRDLNRLNTLTGWAGPHAQVAYWQPSRGNAVLMPPKFFCGDPSSLEESFVASMSLNHAVLPSTNTSFAQELMDQQGAAAALAAHAEYFTRPYAYAKFFRPRAHVLHAYASAIGVRQLPPVANWTAINRRCSLYIEAFPTRSPKFALPPLGPAPAALQSSVFVCALNAIVHDIVLRLLRPRCVLLAGKASWHAWPEPGSTVGADTGHLVRVAGKHKCGVYRDQVTSAVHGGAVTVVRSNFLCTVYGPNSNDELQRLGRDVLT